MNRRWGIGLVTLCGLALIPLFQNFTSSSPVNVSGSSLAKPCSSEKIAEVLEPATAEKLLVDVQCSLSLKKTDVISKRIRVLGAKANGITIDCGGATINGGAVNDGSKKDLVLVQTRRVVENGIVSWSRPENVVIKNCVVQGPVRLKSLNENDLRDSSREAGHTARVQERAPKNITLQNMKIFAQGERTPLFFDAGVTYSSLLNSEVAGRSVASAIYLNTESSFNTIRGNYIHVQSEKREQIAVDGSGFNKIIGNRFSSLTHGGIFLYRNCGEAGIIRHLPPVSNHIINNVFNFTTHGYDAPAIWVGSRQGKTRAGVYGYCGDDRGYPFGSSIDDRDLVTGTVIAQNQIVNQSAEEKIVINDVPQFVVGNESVTAPVSRKNGCFIDEQKRFLKHGEESTFNLQNGRPVCTGKKLQCNDGVLSESPAECPRIQELKFDCQVSSDNRGCEKLVSCPAGTRVVSVKAACNLEYGSVRKAALDALEWNFLAVVRASDHEYQGLCQINDTSISNGSAPLTGLAGKSDFRIACREHDKNGGDCHISGRMLCAP